MELKSWQKGVEAVCTWLRCRRTILVGSLTFSDDQPVLIIFTPGIYIQVSTPARPQTHWEAAETLLLWSVSAVKETIRLIIAFFFIGHHCILVFRHSWGPSVGPSNSAQGIPGFRPAHTGMENNLLQPRPSTWSSHSTGFHCFSRCSSWQAQWSERWLPRELGRAESET